MTLLLQKRKYRIVAYIESYFYFEICLLTFSQLGSFSNSSDDLIIFASFSDIFSRKRQTIILLWGLLYFADFISCPLGNWIGFEPTLG